MEIDQRIPDLSDHELERLYVNAVRLAQSGTPVQRERAERLLPLLGAAQEERRLARLRVHTEQRRVNAQRKAVADAGVKENFK
jgi:hypothetical protein